MNVLDRETIDSLINKFKNYTISHPNISKLWIETLELLKNKNNNLIVLFYLQFIRNH